MRIIIIMLLLAQCGTSARGQINRVVEDFQTEDTISHAAYRRPFVGRFEFQTLPAPLSIVHVDFTLEVNSEESDIPKGDWQIQVLYERRTMQLLSDTVFTWPGSHPLGATYSGWLEFVPTASGEGWFTIQLPMPGYLHGRGLCVGYCLDMDGNLTMLDKREFYLNCERHACQFWAGDTIHVAGYFEERAPTHDLVHYTYSVSPPFCVGETSQVVYHLTAIADALDGYSIDISTRGFKVTSLPDSVLKPLHTLDEWDIRLEVIPIALPQYNKLFLEVCSASRSLSTVITCETIFNGDGTLKCISGWLDGVNQRYLQTSLAAPDSSWNEAIRIERDGVVTRRKTGDW